MLRYVARGLSKEGVLCVGTEVYDDWDRVKEALYMACLVGEHEEKFHAAYSHELKRHYDFLHRLGFSHPAEWCGVTLMLDLRDGSVRYVHDVLLDEELSPFFLCTDESKFYQENFAEVASFRFGVIRV